MTEYKEYSFTYKYDNKVWGVNIYAKSEKEAKEKIKHVCGAEYSGEVTEKGSYNKEVFH